MSGKLVIKKSSLLSFLLFYLFIIILCFIFLKGVVLSFVVCLAMFSALTWKAVNDLNNNSILLFFCISIFVFLIAAPFANLIFGYEKITYFSDSSRNHFYYSLTISLAGVLTAYTIWPRSFVNTRALPNTSSYNRNRLQIISKYFFVFTYSLKIIQYLEIAFYTLRYGYMYYYTAYSSFLPSIVVKVSDMYIVGLSIYLACLPNKKEGKRILLFYILGSCIVGLGGRRFDFVISLVVTICYCLIRDRLPSKEETWIKQKTIILIIVLLPVFILLLMVLGASRSMNEYGFVSFKETFLEFMADVGNSGKVVMRAYEHKDMIPKGRFYSFGSIIEYFKYNEITKLLFGSVPVNPRTEDYALNGHSLAYLVTYLFSRASFYSGHGQGSCYIAELYADFDYIGVFLGSCLLGCFIKQFGSFKTNSVFIDSLCIYFLPAIIHMPRDTFCLPLTYIINLKYIAAFAFVFLISYRKVDNRT